MKVTPALCRAGYEFLRTVSFTGVRLPAARRVEFVAKPLKHHGYYGYCNQRHVIWVNAKTRTLDQLFKIIAHEMCHLALRQYSTKVGDWHDAQFKALAATIEHDLQWPEGSV